MNAEERQFRKMTETPVARLIGMLSIPTVLSMLVTSIYNMADTYFVSQLGTEASGAVGIVFSIQTLIQAVGFGLGMGAGSLVSLHLGQKREKEASLYASSAFVCAILFGFVFLGLGVFRLEGMMRLFGANLEILPYACDYGLYILVGAPLMCGSFVLNNVLRSEGMSKLSMIGLISGSVLNLILDPLFIFDRFLGMQIAGAAIATILSQAISFCILLSFFIRKKTVVRLLPGTVSHHLSDYFRIIRTGIPTVCRQGLASLATTLLNRHAVVYGSAAVAAVTLANRVYMIVRSMVIGIGQGFQPVAGYNYGAGKIHRVRAAFWVSVGFGSAVSVSAAIVCAAFAPDIIALFRRDDAEVIRIGSEALRYLSMVLPLLAYSSYVNQAFQSLGKVRRATLLAASRNGIMFVPLIYALPHFLGRVGVLLTQPVADLFTCILSVPLHIGFFRELKREEIQRIKPSFPTTQSDYFHTGT